MLESSGRKQTREAFTHIPTVSPDDLRGADAIILGIPARYGNMCAQMRNFIDQTGDLWTQGAPVGRIGSVFTSHWDAARRTGDDDHCVVHNNRFIMV